MLRAPVRADVGLSPFSARDEFNQTAGALAGKVAPVGGTWAGAGDTDDFSVNATDNTADRIAVSDANENTGRYATVGSTNYTIIAVQADVRSSAFSTGGEITHLGVLARYVDINNWLMATLTAISPGGPGSTVSYEIRVRKRVAGTATNLKVSSVTAVAANARARTSDDGRARATASGRARRAPPLAPECPPEAS